MADALSKAAFGRFRDLAAAADWLLDLEPCRIPASILRWVSAPSASYDLGHAILLELSASMPILGYSC